GVGALAGPRVRPPRCPPLPRPHLDGAPADAPHAGRMKTGLHQHASLQQQLRINPRLYQAMDLLYMPLLDLQQHLKQELLGNPFLELEEPDEEREVQLSEDGDTPEEKARTGDAEPD